MLPTGESWPMKANWKPLLTSAGAKISPSIAAFGVGKPGNDAIKDSGSHWFTDQFGFCGRPISIQLSLRASPLPMWFPDVICHGVIEFQARRDHQIMKSDRLHITGHHHHPHTKSNNQKSKVRLQLFEKCAFQSMGSVNADVLFTLKWGFGEKPKCMNDFPVVGRLYSMDSSFLSITQSNFNPIKVNAKLPRLAECCQRHLGHKKKSINKFLSYREYLWARNTEVQL